MTTLAIVGSRSFTDYALLKRTVDELRLTWQFTQVVSGGARGADRLGERYARDHALRMIVLKPDWQKGRGAGIQRNGDIVARADFILAFYDGASPGTKNTIARARLSGKDYKVVRFDNRAPPSAGRL
jgi:hypothetical protein